MDTLLEAIVTLESVSSKLTTLIYDIYSMRVPMNVVAEDIRDTVKDIDRLLDTISREFYERRERGE